MLRNSQENTCTKASFLINLKAFLEHLWMKGTRFETKKWSYVFNAILFHNVLLLSNFLHAMAVLGYFPNYKEVWD